MKISCTMFKESSESKSPDNIYAILGIFIGVFFLSAFAESVIPTMMMMPTLIERLQAEGFKGRITINSGYLNRVMELSKEIMSQPRYFSVILICNIFMILIAVIYCRYVEKRPLTSMGFRKKKSARHYLAGVFTGIFMMTADVLLSVVCGVHEIKLSAERDTVLLIVYFIGFLIQGAAEEVIFRGYLMNTIGGKVSPVPAILISSAIFSIAHAANKGFGFLAFFNIVLFGVFEGLHMILYDDIWGACAIHSMWNFFQGNFYGISVSGTDVADSVFVLTRTSDSSILTGGDFGIEGSIFTTLILLLASACLIIGISKKNQRTNLKS